MVKCFFANLQIKEWEAVVVPLPISMHTGQIILLTKMLTESDLKFYEFIDRKAVMNWKAPAASD